MKHRAEAASVLLAVVCALAVVGCSQPAQTPAVVASAAPAAAATDSVAPEPKTPLACELVTASEMSAIVGSQVTAQPNERSSGKTECIYTAVKGISPYVEFSVEWGEGELFMKSAGAMSQLEPGITNPYEGIGDQAVAVGPSLKIRSGADLVSITFSGIEDAPAAAKKIFDTAKARM